jgi:hypothetical protein
MVCTCPTPSSLGVALLAPTVRASHVPHHQHDISPLDEVQAIQHQTALMYALRHAGSCVLVSMLRQCPVLSHAATDAVMRKAFEEGWGGVICKTLSLDSKKVSCQGMMPVMPAPNPLHIDVDSCRATSYCMGVTKALFVSYLDVSRSSMSLHATQSCVTAPTRSSGRC